MVTHTYQSGGLLKTVELDLELVVENTYDQFGRQIKLDDMNAGITLYNYDGFDNLVFQQDAEGNILKTNYDEFGRIESRTVEEVGVTNEDPPSYDYVYYEDGPEKTLLQQETAPSGHATEYTYDDDQNIATITEIIDGEPYTTSFEYDEYGKPTRKEYPSAFAIRYEYDDKGYLERVVSDDGQLIIWEVTNGNAQGQLTNYTLGNGLVIDKFYDDDFFPDSVSASNGENTVFSFEYEFDAVNGNLKSRNLHGTEEHFFYDTDGKHLNRLAGTGPDPNTETETYNFADKGNITSKAGMGPYQYHSQKKNAVTQIDYPPFGTSPVETQGVAYNHFNSASSISNFDDQLQVDLEYGPDDQRRVAKYFDISDGEAPLKTRIYAGSYEKQTDHITDETIEVHYISAGGMLVAMHVMESAEEEEGEYFYPHQDHLGSIIHITDEAGELFYTQSFDPWGRTRNAEDLSYDDIESRPDWLWRGYTGHEHLDEFGLINMNGRLYDPVVGRMLSPDNYVQSPDFSQSYNRYSYVWNNPLKYTDPNGEWVHLVVGAVIGGVVNWSANGAQFNGAGAGYFAVGAVAGALSAGIGAGVSSALAGGSFSAGFVGSSAALTATSSFATGAVVGGASGFAGGFVTGTGNSLIGGNDFETALGDGLKAGAIGAASGAVLGGVIGGMDAALDGRNFWNGKEPYFEGTLDGYEITYQNDMYGDNPKMCKDATLESIEKLNGGNRTQEQFHREGLQRISANDKMNMEDYFREAGFETIDPQGMTVYDLGDELNRGNPTVVVRKSMEGGILRQ